MSKLNDFFAFESLIIKCVLFSNDINYLLKSLINIKAVNYLFINELTVQSVYNQL